MLSTKRDIGRHCPATCVNFHLSMFATRPTSTSSLAHGISKEWVPPYWHRALACPQAIVRPILLVSNPSSVVPLQLSSWPLDISFCSCSEHAGWIGVGGWPPPFPRRPRGPLAHFRASKFSPGLTPPLDRWRRRAPRRATRRLPSDAGDHRSVAHQKPPRTWTKPPDDFGSKLQASDLRGAVTAVEEPPFCKARYQMLRSGPSPQKPRIQYSQSEVGWND